MKLYCKIPAVMFAVMLLLVAFGAQAEEPMPARLEMGAAAGMATVQEVNQETRQVTLRTPDGEMHTFTAGDEVRNLAQVKKGDVVLMEYYEGFAVALRPASGIREASTDTTMARAAEGDKPAAEITETLTLIAQVEGLDRENRLAALRGPKGTMVVKVKDDVDLNKVNVGDEVQAVYIKSFAVSVVPAPEVSGTVAIESKSIALGIGVEWGKGTLTMYDGSTHDFKVNGISVVDIGVSKLSLEGEVFKLTDPKDFAGNYYAGEVGGALIGGGSEVVMKNKQGVVMRLKSIQKGLKLTLAPKGLRVKMAE